MYMRLLFVFSMALFLIQACADSGNNGVSSGSSSQAQASIAEDISPTPKDTQNSAVPAEGGLSVMVLGSGGPAASESKRASAGYLIFADGKPVVLMDLGGGSYQRYNESGVDLKDLDIVLISHLHIDHMADLSAFIKSIYFQNRRAGTYRTAPFHIFGPDENGVPFPATTISQYPSLQAYAAGLYNKQTGIERYMNSFSKAISGGDFSYEAHNLSSKLSDGVVEIFNRDGLVIKSIAVPHGPVPAVAYRVEYKGKSIVYSGDTNSNTENMVQLAMDTDLLIYDTAIMDDAPNGPNDAVFFALHTTPTRMGQVAAAASAKSLLFSHITSVTEPNLDKVASIVREQGYKGEIEKAEDLMVIKLDN